ncbi:MAG TPA: SpoIIE family protein phosphatase [Bryobacteraceae bacterium]|nr:SpoIIE family protein phosphatase [Bryobacteraceae bacterium]
MTPNPEPVPAQPPAAGAATLVVIDPNGRRVRVPLFPFPFRMGRSPDNNLVLRDSRISRNHAQIASDSGDYILEDLGSRHGIWVNGERLEKSRRLEGSERIEFGVPDGYQIHFTRSGEEIQKLLARQDTNRESGRTGTANLEKLRAVLEVARSLQSSFSTDDVLNTVLDAALAVTGAERGFLLLLNEERELQVRSARASGGADLPPDELRVPRRLIQQALESRRDLFSMSFDPTAAGADSPGNTITDLELRSVVCVPLVRVNLSGSGATQMLSAAKSNAGVLYMDSRITAVDLAGGNRELLQTLAIEASTVLENARLLEEEKARQRIEEELDVARRIQQSLLPRCLPEEGWFVVRGSSQSSHQVGGDYFDVIAIGPDAWSMVVADVSGKGVSSALLASFLQGVFLSASATTDIPEVLSRINTFLNDRAEHGKYATMFYSKLDSSGRLTYANAGHCAPLVVRKSGEIERLDATSMPVGLVPSTPFALSHRDLRAGDRIVLYTDGVTEAQNHKGEFFGRARLREAVRAGADADCATLHESILRAILDFTAGAEQADDSTLVVVEYRGNHF